MDQGKTRKLGKGLAGLMNVPVAVPLPPQTDTKPPANASPAESGAAPSSIAPSSIRSAATPAGSGGDAPPAPPAPATPYSVIATHQIAPNRFQPRQDFDEQSLSALAASIRRDGVMQPLVVRASSSSDGAKWELIAGERRLRAAKLAALSHVPAVVVDIDDKTAALWAVVENVQRTDLGPLEKSAAYARLSKDFNLTQQQIAEHVGEDRTLVSHYIRLAELEPPVVAHLRSGALSFGHGKLLNSPLVKPGETRVHLAQRAVHETLSVRQLEHLINLGAGKSLEAAKTTRWTPTQVALHSAVTDLHKAAHEAAARHGIPLPGDEAKARAFEARANVRDLEEQISKALGTKVRIKTTGAGKRGTIVLEFYSLDHFDGLVTKMGVSRES